MCFFYPAAMSLIMTTTEKTSMTGNTWTVFSWLIMITHLGNTWTSLSSSNRESMVFRPFIGFQLRNVKLRKKCFDHYLYIYRIKEICKGENIGLDILIYKKCHKFKKVTVYHLFHYFTVPSFFPKAMTTLYSSDKFYV